MGKDSNAWFLTAGTSRYFFNYRHSADAVLFHELVRSLNVSESNILSWDAAGVVNSPLNPQRGVIYADPSSNRNNIWPDMNIRASAESVSLELLQDTLTIDESSFLQKYGEAMSTVPNEDTTRLTLFLSGHGGDEFFKFHDYEEMDAITFAKLIVHMKLAKRVDKLLILIDTCQASTMGKYLKDIPNVIFVASSLQGENSYALHSHDGVGLSTIDRFSFQMMSLKQTRNSKKLHDYPNISFKQLKSLFPYESLYSNVYVSISNNHSFSAADMYLGHWLKGEKSKSNIHNIRESFRWKEYSPAPQQNPVNVLESASKQTVAQSFPQSYVVNKEMQMSSKIERWFIKVENFMVDRPELCFCTWIVVLWIFLSFVSQKRNK